jgi:hypothetical protein
MLLRLRHGRGLGFRHLAFCNFRFNPLFNEHLLNAGSSLSGRITLSSSHSLRTQTIKQFMECRSLRDVQGFCGRYVYVVERPFGVDYRVSPQCDNELIPSARMDDHKGTIGGAPDCDKIETAKQAHELCLSRLSSFSKLGSNLFLDLLLVPVPVLFVRAAFPFGIECGFELGLKELVPLIRQRQSYVDNVLREDCNLTFGWLHCSSRLHALSPLGPEAKAADSSLGGENSTGLCGETERVFGPEGGR